MLLIDSTQRHTIRGVITHIVRVIGELLEVDEEYSE
jgi:hypothetical protein